jgi:hypothetical protein
MRPTVGFGGPTEAVVDGEIPVIVDPTTTALVLSAMSHTVTRWIGIGWSATAVAATGS